MDFSTVPPSHQYEIKITSYVGDSALIYFVTCSCGRYDRTHKGGTGDLSRILSAWKMHATAKAESEA